MSSSQNHKLVEGVLFEKGGINKPWKERYFILYGNGIILYYKNRSESLTNSITDNQQEINLNDVKSCIIITRESTLKNYGGQYIFQLMTMRRTYTLCCQHLKQFNKWTQYIQQYIKHQNPRNEQEEQNKSKFVIQLTTSKCLNKNDLTKWFNDILKVMDINNDDHNKHNNKFEQNTKSLDPHSISEHIKSNYNDDEEEEEKEEEKQEEIMSNKKEDKFSLNADAMNFIPYRNNLHIKKKLTNKLLPIAESITSPATKICDNGQQKKLIKSISSININKKTSKYCGCNVKIPDKFIQRTVPSRINKKKYLNLHRYIMTSTKLLDGYGTLCDDGKMKIITYDVVDAKSNDLLYCVLKRQPDTNKRRWKLINDVFTAEQIMSKYKIDEDRLPHSFRTTEQFVCELNQKDKIRNMITNIKSMKNMIKQRKWHKISIKNRQNNKQRLTLSFTKEAFMKSLIKYLNSTDKEIRLLDIMLFDDSNIENKKYHIAYVWIVRIAENTDIGISLTYNKQNDSINIDDIHLDKQYLLEQHELINRNHDCHCLDDFKSNINHLMIGNPDQYQNLAKDYQKKYQLIKQEINNLKKQHSDLLEQYENIKQEMVTKCSDSNSNTKQQIEIPSISTLSASSFIHQNIVISNSTITPKTISVCSYQNKMNIKRQQQVITSQELANIQPLPSDLLQSLALHYQTMIDVNGNIIWVRKSNIHFC